LVLKLLRKVLGNFWWLSIGLKEVFIVFDNTYIDCFFYLIDFKTFSKKLSEPLIGRDDLWHTLKVFP